MFSASKGSTSCWPRGLQLFSCDLHSKRRHAKGSIDPSCPLLHPPLAPSTQCNLHPCIAKRISVANLKTRKKEPNNTATTTPSKKEESFVIVSSFEPLSFQLQASSFGLAMNANRTSFGL
ncbi:hypothetical protein L3X38_040179 [Prunus dulcis]|uniref:Uncharacterized protein n=1 Tax=Prunus dulcis TaxID=3755 RepID=A0AAD4V9U6_PRUDU|nr:hypothetical protein L3X38_040179 [Prunus dulcis]